MPLPSLSGRLVIASHNAGKVAELSALFADRDDVTPVSSSSCGAGSPEETGADFGANALLKARHASSATGLPALADDSGLEVEALDGAPGIFSARWGGSEGDFDLAMRRVREALALRGVALPFRASAGGGSGVAARFVCALALFWPCGERLLCEGEVRGGLVWPPRGGCGFGYDPIFVAAGMESTFAEIEPSLKDALSHRGAAWRRMRSALASGGV